jgi:hypothetical protein
MAPILGHGSDRFYLYLHRKLQDFHVYLCHPHHSFACLVSADLCILIVLFLKRCAASKCGTLIRLGSSNNAAKILLQKHHSCMSKKATVPADKLKHPRALQMSGVKPPFLYASFILTRRKRGPFWSSSSNNLKAARRVWSLKVEEAHSLLTHHMETPIT